MKINAALTVLVTSLILCSSSVPASAGWFFKSDEEKLQDSLSKISSQLSPVDGKLFKSTVDLQQDFKNIYTYLYEMSEAKKVMNQGGLTSSHYRNMTIEQARAELHRQTEAMESARKAAEPSINNVFSLMKNLPEYSASWDGPPDRKEKIDKITAIQATITAKNGQFSGDDLTDILETFAAIQKSYPEVWSKQK